MIFYDTKNFFQFFIWSFFVKTISEHLWVFIWNLFLRNCSLSLWMCFVILLRIRLSVFASFSKIFTWISCTSRRNMYTSLLLLHLLLLELFFNWQNTVSCSHFIGSIMKEILQNWVNWFLQLIPQILYCDWYRAYEEYMALQSAFPLELRIFMETVTLVAKQCGRFLSCRNLENKLNRKFIDTVVRRQP